MNAPKRAVRRDRKRAKFHKAARNTTVFLAVRKSQTLEPLAIDEYCRAGTSAFF